MFPFPGGKPCIAQWIPILGVDLHFTLPPIPPPPAPPVPQPHLIVWLEGLSCAPGSSKVANTGNGAKNVLSPIGALVGRGHDAAFVVAHICLTMPLHALLPVIILGSANKVEFGVASVRLPTGPVSVGESFVVGTQLDCSEPFPLPSSKNISILNYTVQAGLTMADIIASLAAMLVDGLITFILGKIAGGLVKGLGKLAERFVVSLGLRATLIVVIIGMRMARSPFVIRALGPQAAAGVTRILEGLMGVALGGPLGWTHPYAPWRLVPSNYQSSDIVFDTVQRPVSKLEQSVKGLFQ
ncbi:MAG TPA: hypothetical protein VFQ61_26445 [Polyangiaceae bacterium]|nr:hypothetical protein [Polyangiaceae bacterium]